MTLITEVLSLDQRTTDPVTPVDGEIWLNETEGVAKIHVAGVNHVFSMFGSFHEHDEDLPESTETGLTYIQQHRYTTPSLPAGTYRVNWAVEFKGTNANRAVALRVQQDDAVDLFENIELMTDHYLSFSHFHSLDLSGIHTFDFDIRRVSAQAVTATIRNITIDIMRSA